MVPEAVPDCRALNADLPKAQGPVVCTLDRALCFRLVRARVGAATACRNFLNRIDSAASMFADDVISRGR